MIKYHIIQGVRRDTWYAYHRHTPDKCLCDTWYSWPDPCVIRDTADQILAWYVIQLTRSLRYTRITVIHCVIHCVIQPNFEGRKSSHLQNSGTCTEIRPLFMGATCSLKIRYRKSELEGSSWDFYILWHILVYFTWLYPLKLLGKSWRYTVAVSRLYSLYHVSLWYVIQLADPCVIQLYHVSRITV